MRCVPLLEGEGLFAHKFAARPYILGCFAYYNIFKIDKNCYQSSKFDTVRIAIAEASCEYCFTVQQKNLDRLQSGSYDLKMINFIMFKLNKEVKRILIVGLMIAIAGILGGCSFSSGVPDVMLSNLELITNSSQVTGVRFSIQNSGDAIPSLSYRIIFSEDTVIDITSGDSIVYEQTINVAGGSIEIVEVDFNNDLSPWLTGKTSIVPAGEYYIGVVVDPEDTIPEEFETNNSKVLVSSFSYGGSVPGITLDITYDFNMPLNTENPLRLLIVDSWEPDFLFILLGQINSVVDADAALHNGWVGRYANVTVENEGVVFIPAADLPPINPGSIGYYVFFLYDSGADWDFQSNRYIHLDEGYGRYDSTGTGNVIYYPFTHYEEVKMGVRYSIAYALTALPGDDAFVDNDSLTTAFDFGSLNFGQNIFTSNLEAIDNDWFEIYVNGTGVNLQVDLTFSHTDLDLYMELYDASGNLLETADTKTDNEVFNYTVVTPDTYFVRVYHLEGTLGASPYSIRFGVN